MLPRRPPDRPALERLEPRRLLASIGDSDLFTSALNISASGSSTNAAFSTANLNDASNAAFLFNDAAGPHRLSVAGFNASIHTLRFFDTPSYLDRAAGVVSVYHSPLNQLSLTPASYRLLGTFNLAPVNIGATAAGDRYATPTSPADHPRAADPSSNPGATIAFAQISGLAIPPGTRSILLDFGVNSAGLGFGLSEIQAFGTVSPARAPDATLLGWGQNVYQKTVASLKVPSSNLFAETASTSGTRSGGVGGFAFVWPAATQFRVLTALLRIDPATYEPIVRAYSDELRTRYLTNSGAGGYRSSVSSGGTRFYDDNGHIAVALAEAYQLTGDPVLLTRAIQTYDYVLTGEDSAAGGGIYFSEPDDTSKDAISTLQAVRAGLMLHQITGQSRFLADAQRLYNWSKSHIQQSDGLFAERFLITANRADGNTLINSAGIGISSNLLFYATTGDSAYLREAQRIAARSIPRYFNSSTGAINDEGFWAFELVDAFNDLYLTDFNPKWLNAIKGAMNWLRANREDPNGHYGELWGRGGTQGSTVLSSWHLNDQAAVARSYLYTAAVNLVAPPFVTAPADSIFGIYGATVGGGHLLSVSGSSAGQYPASDPPPRIIDANAATKYLNYGSGNSSVSSPTKGVGTGFYITPALGPSIVTGIQIATAADFASRDPLTVSIEGTNATGGFNLGATWTLIADNINLGINTDPGRQAFAPIITFPNSTAYRSYRVIIKSQRGSDIGVQYGEINLVGGRDSVPPRIAASSFDFDPSQSVALTFNEDVSASLAAADLLVENLTTGQTIAATAMQVTWDAGQRRARWSFPGYPTGLPDGNYRATLAAGVIADASQNALFEPHALDFFVFAADINRDRQITFTDLLTVSANFGKSPATQADGDTDQSGAVGFVDLLTVAAKFGSTLPPHSAPAPAAADANTALFSTTRLAAQRRPVKRKSFT